MRVWFVWCGVTELVLADFCFGGVLSVDVALYVIRALLSKVGYGKLKTPQEYKCLLEYFNTYPMTGLDTTYRRVISFKIFRIWL